MTVGADEPRRLAKGKTVSLRSEPGFDLFENNEVILQAGTVVGIK